MTDDTSGKPPQPAEAGQPAQDPPATTGKTPGETKTEPDLRLARFLTNLAASGAFLARFQHDLEDLMTEAGLSDAAKKAIRESKQNDLIRLISISQQNS